MRLPETQPLVDELLAALDEELVVLDTKCRHLKALSEHLVARDNDGAEVLMQQMELAEADQRQADHRLGAAGGLLAGNLGLSPGSARLSDLIPLLPPDVGRTLQAKRQQLVDGASRLRRRHLETAMLLGECMRINRTLLEAFKPSCQSVVTYGVGGSDRWRDDAAGLIDTEL